MVDDAYLKELSRITAQGQDLGPHPTASNYAPTVIAGAVKGIQKPELEAAQKRLLDAGNIHIEPVGPPSKQRKYIRPWLRSVRRARKIRMRLGTGFSFAEPFPDKPPRMHWLNLGGRKPVRSCGVTTCPRWDPPGTSDVALRWASRHRACGSRPSHTSGGSTTRPAPLGPRLGTGQELPRPVAEFTSLVEPPTALARRRGHIRRPRGSAANR
jgi:hypothetical protein